MLINKPAFAASDDTIGIKWVDIYRSLCKQVLLRPSGPLCRARPLVRRVSLLGADSGGLLAFRWAHVGQPAGICRTAALADGTIRSKVDGFEYSVSCKQVLMQPSGPYVL